MHQFINSLLGEQVASVSSGTSSCTEDIKEFQFELKDGLTVTLVDTPGLDCYFTNGGPQWTNDDILRMIAEFLNPP